jgi:hypothetical protein
MNITRRQFNRGALLGGASFAASSVGILFPKPAEAITTEFPLEKLSSGLVFGGIRRYSAAAALPGILSEILDKNSSSGINPEIASVIRSADQSIVDQNFSLSRTELAKANVLLWGRQRQDKLGPNVGFGFVQEYQDGISNAVIWGPTMTAIHIAQPWLANQKLNPNEIAGSLLPVRSTYDDLSEWSGEKNSGVSFTAYRTVLGEVTVRYDLKEPGPGGFGIIQLTMEAEDQPRRNVIVKARFS